MTNLPYNEKLFASECENALTDFPFHDEVKTWLTDHKNLFETASLLMNEAFEKNKNSEKIIIIRFYYQYLENKK
jgi:hypothetical protein